jgi:cytoskeletal protein CcmA (bactofilin family)
MADKVEDLDIPKMLARTAAPASARVPLSSTPIPPRAVEVARPGTDSAKPAASELGTSNTKPMEPRSMVVGRGLSLSGDIKFCNRLVVEGEVEVTLHDCREIEIGETGLFKGNASIEQAEVRGQFEGELVVSKRLLIRSTGHVSGTITYGEIEIERGGKVSGVMQEAGPISYFGVARAGE